MNTKKLLVLTASIALLAAGCSKAKTPAQTPPPATAPAPTPAAAIQEFDPAQDWIRFYPGETTKFNLAIAKTWTGDDDATDTHFVLRSRVGADGTAPDDMIFDFTVAPLTAGTLSEQVSANIKSAKSSGPVVVSKTDTGAQYAFAPIIDSAGKSALVFAVQYPGTQYIKVKVTGNITHPYIGRVMQSIVLMK